MSRTKFEPISICIHEFERDLIPTQIICNRCWELRDAATGTLIKEGKIQ